MSLYGVLVLGRVVVMRCEPCGRKMERKRVVGTEWVFVCPKCKARGTSQASPEDVAKFKARAKEFDARKRQTAAREAAEARGECPDGEDPELWAMRRVMTQEFDRDVGPRQTFYRRLYDDEPFRFAKMMQDREAFVKRESESVAVDKDDGVGRSLELAETLLGEVANVGQH